MPAVGDWVLVEPSSGGPSAIQQILERTGVFVRRKAGTETGEQVVAANVDTAFLMSSLNQEFNPRRIERYLAVAWESGAQPEIVLSKADIAVDIEQAQRTATEVGFGVPVWVV